MTGRISGELLVREGQRLLARRYEWILLVFFTGVPAGAITVVLLLPFDLRESYHRLLLCGSGLAAWYSAICLTYLIIRWAGMSRDDEDRDLRHLPLSPAHFFLARALRMTLVPLLACALSLPLWFILLVYTGLPYDQHLITEDWRIWRETSVHWFTRIGWATAAILSAPLIPLSLGLLLENTYRRPAVKAGLLLGGALTLLALQNQFPDHFRAPYRATEPFDTTSFLGVVLLAFVLTGLIGLFSPVSRQWILAALAALLIGLVAAPRLDGMLFETQWRFKDHFSTRSPVSAAVWLAGHLIASRNSSLLLEKQGSAVLLSAPDSDLPTSERERTDHLGRTILPPAKSPRIALWFGAGLIPLVLPLLLFGSLLLGALVSPRE